MTYPLATLGPTITPAGITVPALQDIIQSMIATRQGIFGEDIYLGTDSQDYQLLATEAQAIYDTNAAFVAAYNSFSPQTATGVGLSNVVKINGIQREAASNSTAIISIGGVAGTSIPAGVVQDQDGNLWNLPANIVIPPAGTIDVTGTCQTPGAIAADAGAIDTPYTIVLGWQTATNAAAADVGAPQEKDGQLRQRQTISTAIPSQTSLSAIIGAVANVPGVSRSTVYENDSATTDGNGVPSHSIAVVVEGGDAMAIATAIELEKDQGCGTYGTTAEVVTDPSGLPVTIRFFELTQIPIWVVINITARAGFVSSTEDDIKAAVVAFINALGIGEDVYQAWLVAEAGLANTGLQQTFVISSLYLGTAPAPGTTADVNIAFNAAATCTTANVSIVVP